MKILSQSISIILASLLVAGQLPADASAGLQIRLLDSDGLSAVAGSKTLKGFTVQVTDEAGNGVADAAVVFRLPDSPASGVFTDGTHAAVGYTDEGGRAHVTGIQWTSTAGVIGIRITATKGTSHAGVLLEETLTASAPAPALARSVAMPAPTIEHKAESPAAQPGISTPQPKVNTQEPEVKVLQPGTLAASSHLPSPEPAAAENAPSVSVTNGRTNDKVRSGSKTKWIILAAVIAAGAGAGIAMAGKSKSSSSSSSTGVSIGGPTISVGTP